jgi:hypothetical protein
MQYRSSKRYIILSETRMRQTRVASLHYLAATHTAVLRGSKKSRMCMKVPSTTALSFPTLSPLLTAGRNKVKYFLDRPCILSIWQGKVSVNPTNVVIANQCSD